MHNQTKHAHGCCLLCFPQKTQKIIHSYFCTIISFLFLKKWKVQIAPGKRWVFLISRLHVSKNSYLKKSPSGEPKAMLLFKSKGQSNLQDVAACQAFLMLLKQQRAEQKQQSRWPLAEGLVCVYSCTHAQSIYTGAEHTKSGNRVESSFIPSYKMCRIFQHL